MLVADEGRAFLYVHICVSQQERLTLLVRFVIYTHIFYSRNIYLVDEVRAVFLNSMNVYFANEVRDLFSLNNKSVS